MDTRIIKIAIAAASLAYTIYLFMHGYIGSGIGMSLVTIVLVLINLRSVRTLIAFFQMRQQKMDKAALWLNRVNPDKLWKNQQGFYYFLQGSVVSATNLNEAEKMFKKAIGAGLKQEYYQAAAKLQLAYIAAAKNRRKEGQMLLNEAKKLDKKKMLKGEIKQIEQVIKNPRVKFQRR